MENRRCMAAAVALVVAALWGQTPLSAMEVRQMFRPERFQRGDTNVSRVQDIDDAHWIWHPTAVTKGEVTLPEGVSGVFERKGRSQPLKPGRNTL